MRQTAITLCLIFICSAQVALAKTPNWVKEFWSEAIRIVRISGNNSYQAYQTNLKTLEITGKGNCIAWSKLMNKIAYRHNIKFENFIVDKICTRRCDRPASHQITLLTDASGQLWAQSNMHLFRVEDIDEAFKYIAKEIRWSRGCTISSRFIIKEADLYRNN